MADGRKGPAGKRGGRRKANPDAERRRLEAIERRRAAAEAKRKAREDEADSEALEMARSGELTGAAVVIERAELYMQVFADWGAGMDFPTLAKRHNMSQRNVQRVVSELRGQRLNVMRLGDPLVGLRIAQDLVMRWSAAISQYANLAAETDHDGVRLGALRRRDEALESFTQLMQELGYLPKHLGTLRVQEDFLGLMDTLLDKMDQLGVDMEVQRALVEAVELRATPQRGSSRLALGVGADVIDGDGVSDAAAA
jgi:hypothetical protein